MIYYTFYSFLFALGDFEYTNGRKINKIIFTFFDNLTEIQCKIGRVNFTKICNKSVDHGWAAKNVLISGTSTSPILSF